MRVGVAKTKITPAAGSPLSGYRARSGNSTGVHDELYARAIAFEKNDIGIILISVDVLALSVDYTMHVQARISHATSVPITNILIAATHTHSGPHVIQTFFNMENHLDPDYMNQLAERIAQSGVRAWQERQAARVGVGACLVDGVGTNRRDPDNGPVDREAAIIRVDTLDGSLKAVAVIYGCHPTILGVGNLLITGDFPAMTVMALERNSKGNIFALFFNGAVGDISIGHSSGMSAIGMQTPGRTFKRASELGERLATAVLDTLPSVSTTDSTDIGIATLIDTLEGRRFPPVSELRQTYEEIRRTNLEFASRKIPSDTESLIQEVYAVVRYNNARELEKSGGCVPFTLAALRIGQAMFLAVPAEVFSETGLAIKQSVSKYAYIVGLANGYIGYLPSEKAYQEGGYEVEVAVCSPTSEQKLIYAARRLRAQLFPEQSNPSEVNQ